MPGRRLTVAYRSQMQRVLLCVMDHCDLWGRHGFAVAWRYYEGDREAETALFRGEVDLIIGQHLLPYVSRAQGKKTLCLAQAMNLSLDWLVCVPSIADPSQLAGKRLAVYGARHFPGLTIPFHLENLGLAASRDGISFVPTHWDDGERVKALLDGRAEAALVRPPFDLLAEAEGLRRFRLAPVPILWGVTVTADSETVAREPEFIKDFLKAIITGIHFFKTRKDDSVGALVEKMREDFSLRETALAEHLWEEYGAILEPKPYPSLAALQNTLRVAALAYPGEEIAHPFTVWDLRFVREIDESGFIDGLYTSR